VVCIIEAMKVMNEIKQRRVVSSPRSWLKTVKPVQFGQVLFKVR